MQNTGILKPVKLPYMQTYCIYYSVRFGVLVVGLFTMVNLFYNYMVYAIESTYM